MARKTVESSKKEKSGVRDLIIHAFELRQEKPDASHFGRWSIVLNTFIKPEDESYRRYSAEEMKHVIDYLHSKGVRVEAEHFNYAGLVASITDEKLGTAQVLINQILQKQDRLYESPVNYPSGW